MQIRYLAPFRLFSDHSQILKAGCYATVRNEQGPYQVLELASDAPVSRTAWFIFQVDAKPVQTIRDECDPTSHLLDCCVLRNEDSDSPYDLASFEFSGKTIRGANLHRATLPKDLTEAHFEGALFYGAQFGDADLTGSLFTDANFQSADLSHVKLPSLTKLLQSRVEFRRAQFDKYTKLPLAWGTQRWERQLNALRLGMVDLTYSDK